MHKELLEQLDSVCEHGDVKPVNYTTNNCKHCELIAQAADVIRAFPQDRADAVAQAVETGYAAGYRDCLNGSECLYPLDIPKPEPLYPSQLMEMEGQPVWLHTFSVVNKKTRISSWAIINHVDGGWISFVRAGVNNQLTKTMGQYGKSWLAYRYPIKEE